MTDEPFVPFDANAEEVAQRRVLRPGVPPGMRMPLINWLFGVMASEHRYVRLPDLHSLENVLDIDLGMNPKFSGVLNDGQFREVMHPLPERQLLRVVDYRLSLLWRGSSGSANQLDGILIAGRSKWRPVERDRHFRLTERVPQGVQTAAEALFREGTAGRLLNDAWNHVHDLQPRDSAAYAAAVKAVETAAIPVLSIDSKKPDTTIGDIARYLEQDKSWRLPFVKEHSHWPSNDLLVGLLRSLYRGQRDRHGAEAYSDVTHEEAEGAVLLAVTLVGWFSQGLIQQRDGETFA